EEHPFVPRLREAEVPLLREARPRILVHSAAEPARARHRPVAAAAVDDDELIRKRETRAQCALHQLLLILGDQHDRDAARLHPHRSFHSRSAVSSPNAVYSAAPVLFTKTFPNAACTSMHMPPARAARMNASSFADRRNAGNTRPSRPA